MILQILQSSLVKVEVGYCTLRAPNAKNKKTLDIELQPERESLAAWHTAFGMAPALAGEFAFSLSRVQRLIDAVFQQGLEGRWPFPFATRRCAVWSCVPKLVYRTHPPAQDAFDQYFCLSALLSLVSTQRIYCRACSEDFGFPVPTSSNELKRRLGVTKIDTD